MSIVSEIIKMQIFRFPYVLLSRLLQIVIYRSLLYKYC